MMFIVDGTGQDDDKAYDKEMAGGFCRTLERECGGLYWRGPTTLGNETVDIAKEVVDAVQRWRRIPGVHTKLFMAGHSRGGAALIFAAQALQKLAVQVEAMFLFDAVDRTFNRRDAQTVPGNVKVCYHALRDTSLAYYYSDGVRAARDKVAQCMGMPTGRRPVVMEDLLDTVLKSPPPPGPCAEAIRNAQHLAQQDWRMKLVMRSVTMTTPEGPTIDFGNCAVESEGECVLIKEKFLGSHGALGGAPIVDQRAPDFLIDSDRAAMACVRSWMWGHLHKHQAFKPA